MMLMHHASKNWDDDDDDDFDYSMTCSTPQA
jgi:hypothetical protein